MAYKLKVKSDTSGNTVNLPIDAQTVQGEDVVNTKQDKLTTTSVSDGTINKVIGFDTNGNIVKSTPSAGTMTDVQINSTSIVSGTVANIITNGVYNATSNKIATMSDVPTLTDDISDTNQTNKYVTQEMYEYLENQLYKKPTISSFYMCDNSGNSLSTTNETGTVLTAYKFKHQETNITNISTLKYQGSTNVTPSSSLATVTLPSSVSISSTTTFTLSGTDTKGNSFSNSASYNFYTYAYTKVTSSSTTPTSGLTKQSVQSTFESSGATISYSANDYIYFYDTSSGKTVQQNVLGTWMDVTTESLGQKTITLANGTTKSYYAYRIGPFMASGSDTLRLH